MSGSRLRVAVDAHQIGRQATGNETYVRSLLGAMRLHPHVHPIALVDAGVSLSMGIDEQPLSRRSAIRRLAGQLRAPGHLWDADVLHVQYVRPPSCDVPVVTTVHDISFEHYPELFTRRARYRMRLTIPWSARHSAAVLTGSRYSRDDLIATYRLAPDSVHVTPYAASEQFRPLAAERARAAIDRADLPEGFILCVGNLQPRKNLARLVEAYASLRSGGYDVPLVIVGQKAWMYADLFDVVRKHRLTSSVVFTGFVTNEQLVGLYNGALVFAYPSLFEGFGLPVLEALACGAPTLTSSTTSLPEVAGDAALLIDPFSIDDIREGLRRLLDDDSLRESLRQAGPRQAAQFSWARCANETAAVYSAAVGRESLARW